MEQKDYQIVSCKACGISKKRIREGKRPSSKETKFVGEDGLEWNGLKCGTCHSTKVKQTKQLNAKLKKQAKEFGK